MSPSHLNGIKLDFDTTRSWWPANNEHDSIMCWSISLALNKPDLDSLLYNQYAAIYANSFKSEIDF